MGWGPGDASPGTSLACAQRRRSSSPCSLPFPNPLLCPHCSLNYSPEWWLDSPPCLPKGGNSYLPHLPLEGGTLPSWLAGAPTSTWMGHLASELGPAGGKRSALGTALPVTSCGPVLPNQKAHGPPPLSWPGSPGGLVQRDSDTLRAGRRGSHPCGECGGSGGHFQSRMGKVPRSRG